MFLTSNFYKYQTESFENDLKAFKAQLILNNIKKEDAPNRKMIERNRKKSPYLSHISHVSPFNNLNNNYTDPHFDNLEANKLQWIDSQNLSDQYNDYTRIKKNIFDIIPVNEA